MNRRIILLFVLMLSGMASIAQNRLVPGYVVVNSGDTLRGFISLKGYYTAPDSIFFSKESKGQGVHYTVENCSAFGTNDELYLRWAVSMDMSVMNKLDNRIHNEDSTLLDTVFLRRVYAGKTLSLFKYFQGNENSLLQEETKKMHFFLYDGGMQELVLRYKNPIKNERFLTQAAIVGGNVHTRTTLHYYRLQLSAYCEWDKNKTVKRRLDGLQYEERPLIKFIALIDGKQ